MIDATATAQADVSVIVTSSPVMAARVAIVPRPSASTSPRRFLRGSRRADALVPSNFPTSGLVPPRHGDAGRFATATPTWGSVPTIPSLGVEARGASQLLIRENTIPANVSVVFAVRIRRTTAETTTASASVTIFTREGAVLKVSVNPGSGIVNSGTDIRLRAAATGVPAGSPATTYAWSVVSRVRSTSQI